MVTVAASNPLSLAAEALRSYAFEGLPIEASLLLKILLASAPFTIVGALTYLAALRKLQVEGKL
jgi:hypothetical protein